MCGCWPASSPGGRVCGPKGCNKVNAEAHQRVALWSCRVCVEGVERTHESRAWSSPKSGGTRGPALRLWHQKIVICINCTAASIPQQYQLLSSGELHLHCLSVRYFGRSSDYLPHQGFGSHVSSCLPSTTTFRESLSWRKPLLACKRACLLRQQPRLPINQPNFDFATGVLIASFQRHRGWRHRPSWLTRATC